MSVMDKITTLKTILNMVEKVVTVMIKVVEYVLEQKDIVNA